MACRNMLQKDSFVIHIVKRRKMMCRQLLAVETFYISLPSLPPCEFNVDECACIAGGIVAKKCCPLCFSPLGDFQWHVHTCFCCGLLALLNDCVCFDKRDLVIKGVDLSKFCVHFWKWKWCCVLEHNRRKKLDPFNNRKQTLGFWNLLPVASEKPCFSLPLMLFYWNLYRSKVSKSCWKLANKCPQLKKALTHCRNFGKKELSSCISFFVFHRRGLCIKWRYFIMETKKKRERLVAVYI